MHITYGAIDTNEIQGFERRLREQPIFYCLRGQLDPGETFARFKIDSGVFPVGVLRISLENLTFCRQQDDAAQHGNYHFRPLPTVDYPPLPDDAVYQDEIEIRVPRPVPLVHRRRTVYFIEGPTQRSYKVDIDDDDRYSKDNKPKADDYIAYPGQESLKRKLDIDLVLEDVRRLFEDEALMDERRITVKRFKRTLEEEQNSSYRVQISSNFQMKMSGTFEEFRYRDSTLTFLADKITAGIKKCNEKFGGLFKDLPSVNTIVAEPGPEEEAGSSSASATTRSVTKERLKIVLPPQTCISFDQPDFWEMLGFVDEYRLSKLDNGSFRVTFENDDAETTREIISKESFRASSRFTAIVGDYAARKAKKPGLANLKNLITNDDKMLIQFGPTRGRIHFFLNHLPESMIADFPGPNHLLEINSSITIFNIWLTELGKAWGFHPSWFRIKKNANEKLLTLIPGYNLKKTCLP